MADNQDQFRGSLNPTAPFSASVRIGAIGAEVSALQALVDILSKSTAGGCEPCGGTGVKGRGLCEHCRGRGSLARTAFPDRI